MIQLQADNFMYLENVSNKADVAIAQSLAGLVSCCRNCFFFHQMWLKIKGPLLGEQKNDKNKSLFALI